MMRSPHPLRRIFAGGLVMACVTGVLATPGFLRVATAAQPPTEWDGLQLRNSRLVDRLWVRPEASLAGYKRVRLARLQVYFDRNWRPNAGRTGLNRLTTSDFDRIKNTLADEFARTFTSELAKGGYQVTEEAAEDVLDIQPFIVDLVVTAPSTRSAGSTWTYTANAGRMTLVAELRDSETGQIIARAIDAQRARGSGPFQITNNVTNMAAARQALSQWARALRQALDEAEGRSDSGG